VGEGGTHGSHVLHEITGLLVVQLIVHFQFDGVKGHLCVYTGGGCVERRRN